MKSSQIATSPILRQFAVQLGSSIEVSTKLGKQTLIRTSFGMDDFPTDSELQLAFLKNLISKANPGALDILEANASRCLEDQVAAVRKVIEVS